jgi:signal transduction histidine kinase
VKSRTWPVLFFGFGSLVLLIALAGLGAARRASQIHTEMAAIYESHRETTMILNDIRSGVNLSGIYVRDYLLDPSHLMASSHRQRLLEIRTSTARQLEQLRARIGKEDAGALARMSAELDGYWDSLDPLFDWTPQQKTALSSFFLRQTVLPRRDAVLEIARGIREFTDTNLKLQQASIQRSQTGFYRYLAWMLSVVILLGVLVAAISVFRITRLENEREGQQARTARAEGELRRLSRELVRAQESERKSLSRELHDEVGQTLTALRMELANLEAVRTSPGEEFSTRLGEAKQLAEQTLASVRNLAMGLRPAMLDDLGLGPALEWQGREFSRRSGIPVNVQIDGDLEHLPETHGTSVFRIVQEALTNCARHSQAKSIRITVHGGPAAVRVSVQDDGVGLQSIDSTGRGLGLIGIEERARELGGLMTIDSQPGKGMTLHVEIPLSQEATA